MSGQRRFQSKSIQLVFYCVMALGTLLVMELLARALYTRTGSIVYIPDPTLGYRPAPNQGMWLASMAGEFNIWFETNSHGDADIERAKKKPDDVFRVAVLGDSFVEAAQVSREQHFASLLEARLTRTRADLGDPGPVEVLTFGVAGYSAAQSWLNYKAHVRQFAPDVVIFVLFPGNDVQGDSYDLEVVATGRPEVLPFLVRSATGDLVLKDQDFSRRAEDEFRPDSRGLLRESYKTAREVFRLLALLHDAMIAANNRLFGEEPGISDEQLRHIKVWTELHDADVQAASPEWREAWTVTGEILREFERAAVHDGADFHVVILPSAWEINPASRSNVPESLVTPGLDWQLPSKMADRLLADTGIGYINVRPAMEAEFQQGRNPHFAVDGHLSREGHQLIAAELQQAVQNYLAKALTLR